MMNEPTPKTEPDDLNHTAQTESLVPELDESIGPDMVEPDAAGEEEEQGVIHIPTKNEDGLESQVESTASLSPDKHPTITVAYRCLVGPVRQRNEDSCLVFSSGAGGHFSLMPFGLYVVADGMGGHANGHVASKTASRVASRLILEKIFLPLLHDQEELKQTPIQEVLVNAVQAANSAVYATDPESDSGTTLTVALVLGRRLHVAHVGDSRLYLLGKEGLEPVTSDHSLVQRLQDVGQPADDFTFSQIRHVLLRAVGQVEEVEVDTYMRLLPKTGKLLICTDGLSGPLSNEHLEELLVRDVPIEEMVDDLANAAIEFGSNDNVTAIVVDFAF